VPVYMILVSNALDEDEIGEKKNCFLKKEKKN
jgi:hypothetical protein